jgi:hypothetical protein
MSEDMRAVYVAEQVRVEGLRPVLVEVADAHADDADPEGGGVVVRPALNILFGSNVSIRSSGVYFFIFQC